MKKTNFQNLNVYYSIIVYNVTNYFTITNSTFYNIKALTINEIQVQDCIFSKRGSISIDKTIISTIYNFPSFLSNSDQINITNSFFIQLDTTKFIIESKLENELIYISNCNFNSINTHDSLLSGNNIYVEYINVSDISSSFIKPIGDISISYIIDHSNFYNNVQNLIIFLVNSGYVTISNSYFEKIHPDEKISVTQPNQLAIINGHLPQGIVTIRDTIFTNNTSLYFFFFFSYL